eukprot:m.314922 g.314922  ORF g.314922 m.314922 type:complete len:1108 (-) comp19670_c2_seq9:693-4016(-)
MASRRASGGTSGRGSRNSSRSSSRSTSRSGERAGKSAASLSTTPAPPTPGEDVVRVAVRVRPFNLREKRSGQQQCVVTMDASGATTTLAHPTGARPQRTFTFDHSYWSCDGFEEDADGVLRATTPRYAEQQRLFDDLALGLVDDAFKGYNAAIMAYGQTGSGKSYSMVGYGRNKGVIPLTCAEVFKRVDAAAGQATEHQVTFSMLEVYNERIRDLLRKKSSDNLKVRQHPKSGFYVQGLSTVPVSSYRDIQRLMDQGALIRTTAATKLNETSSRSHMVVTLRLKTIFLNKGGEKTAKTSEFHLVDLAGSERTDRSGATGDRLKEGSAINKSLHTLGLVISALAESVAPGGKGAKQFIPYRDSVLTMLLSNALGGNSRSVMLATISPAASDYEETLSTLRYADRAKQIRNSPIVNETPTERLIRELQEENKRLQAMLGGSRAQEGAAELIAANEQQVAQLNMTWDDMLSEARAQWQAEFETSDLEADEKLAVEPHLLNVNEDPILSGVVHYVLAQGRCLIRRLQRQPSDDAGQDESASVPNGYDSAIALGGLSISDQHAVFTRADSTVTIAPLNNAQVMVNGKQVLAETELRHRDRVVLAPNHLYVFMAAASARSVSDGAPLDDITYEYVQMELASAQGLLDGSDQQDGVLDRQTHDDIVNLLPMIVEANALSEELGKATVFSPMIKNLALHDPGNECREVLVRVVDKQSGHVWTWDKGKFLNRRFLMLEEHEAYLEGMPACADLSSDPFWDPPEDVFIGAAHVLLSDLGYLLNIDEVVPVMNYQGQEQGSLRVFVQACDSKGKPLPAQMSITSPQELKGTRMDLQVKISSASGVKWAVKAPARGVDCRFKFYTDPKQRCTKAVFNTTEPKFGYTKQFTMKSVSDSFLSYLESNTLVIEMWGKQDECPSLTSNTAALRAGLGRQASTDDARLDMLVKEAAWIEEKKALLATIDSLRNELEMTNIEHQSAMQRTTSASSVSSLHPGSASGARPMLPRTTSRAVINLPRSATATNAKQMTRMTPRDAETTESLGQLARQFELEDEVLREHTDVLAVQSITNEQLHTLNAAYHVQAQRAQRIETILGDRLSLLQVSLDALRQSGAITGENS